LLYKLIYQQKFQLLVSDPNSEYVWKNFPSELILWVFHRFAHYSLKKKTQNFWVLLPTFHSHSLLLCDQKTNERFASRLLQHRLYCRNQKKAARTIYIEFPEEKEEWKVFFAIDKDKPQCFTRSVIGERIIHSRFYESASFNESPYTFSVLCINKKLHNLVKYGQ
jgi:hypothetical protein